MTQEEMIDGYIDFIEKFVNYKIPIDKFQIGYMHLGRNYYGTSEKLYNITNNLFYDVEEFCVYPELRKEGDIDEEGLYLSAKKALKKLIKLKEEINKK